MVVFGLRDDVARLDAVSFARIDPATCQPSLFGRKHFSFILPTSPTAWRAWRDPERHSYIMDTFEPGVWVLASSVWNEWGEHNTHYDFGSMAFVARPGEFIFIGDITIGDGVVFHDGHNRAAMQEELAAHVNISVAPRDHPFIGARFGRAGALPNCRALLETSAAS